MSGSYDKQGIRFQYPENWHVTDEETRDWPRSVSVQSPDGGFWTLMVYPPEKDPDRLTEEVLSAMRSEYDEVEATPVDIEIDGIGAAGYDMMFYCLDFVISSKTLAVRAGDRTILMLWQAEDREYQRLEPVFHAISISLLREHQPSP